MCVIGTSCLTACALEGTGVSLFQSSGNLHMALVPKLGFFAAVPLFSLPPVHEWCWLIGRGWGLAILVQLALNIFK